MEDIVGFAFRPKDDELVGYYLRNKILGYETSRIDRAIKVVKICDYDPWDLRFESKIESKDLEWYFFSCIEKKYAIGNRQNRKTTSGKWKLTGEAVEVKDHLGIWCKTPGKKIGHKRVLVFQKNGNGNVGIKSDWVIHEYHYTLLPEEKRTYVICRLEYKGNDINIAKAINPTPSIQVNQPLEGFYNAYPEYDPANQFIDNFDDMFIDNFDDMPHLPINDQWFIDHPLNQQPSVPYSAPFVDEYETTNLEDFFVEKRTYVEYRSVCIPIKTVTGFLTDDSSNSDTGYSTGTDTPIDDDIPSLNTIESLHNLEAQEQPKLQQKVINTQECATKWNVFEEISQRNSQLIYLKNMIIGFLLYISIIRWIILV